MSSDDDRRVPKISKSRRLIISDSDSSEESVIVRNHRKRKSHQRVVSDAESSDEGSDVQRPVNKRKNHRLVSESESSYGSSDTDDTEPNLIESDSSEWQSDWQSLDENEDTAEPSPKNKGKKKKTKSSDEKNDSKASASGFESDNSDGQSEKCPICLLPFRKQEIATPSSCEHCFCLECILEWSKNINTCPVDRQTFTVIKVKSHTGTILRYVPVEVKNTVEEIIQEDPTYCEICGGCDREDRLLLCDGCDLGYHMECLQPPLFHVPLDEWYCPECAQNSQNDAEAISRNDLRNFVRFSAIQNVIGPRAYENLRQMNNTIDIDLDEVPDLIEEARRLGLSYGRTRGRQIQNSFSPRIIPRTRQTERVRANIRAGRSLNLSRDTRNRENRDRRHLFEADQPSTSSGIESIGENSRSRSPDINAPSTSSGRARVTRRAPVKRKIKKPAQSRSKTVLREVRITEINDDGEEEEIVSYVKIKTSETKSKSKTGKKKKCKKRKKRRSKKRARTVLSVVNAKRQNRGMTLMVPTKNVPAQAESFSEVSSSRNRAGIPQLSLFGGNLSLDYYSPGSDDEIDSVGQGPAIVARPRRTISTLRRRVALKGIANPTPSIEASSSANLLDSIIQSQELWHSKKSSDVKIKIDGSLVMGNNEIENAHNVNNNDSPIKKKGESNPQDKLPGNDQPLDLSNVNPNDITQAPMYNSPRGGGNRGNFRGGYRDNNRQSHGGQGYSGRDSYSGGGRRSYGGSGMRDSGNRGDFGPPVNYTNFEHRAPANFGTPPFRNRNPQHFRNDRNRYSLPERMPFQEGGERPPFPFSDNFTRAPPPLMPLLGPRPLGMPVGQNASVTRDEFSAGAPTQSDAPFDSLMPSDSAEQHEKANEEECDIYSDMVGPSKHVESESHNDPNSSSTLLPPPEPPSGLLDFDENSKSEKDNDSDQELVIDDTPKDDAAKAEKNDDKYDPFNAEESDSNDSTANKTPSHEVNKIPAPIDPPPLEPPPSLESFAGLNILNDEFQEPIKSSIRLTAYDDDEDEDSQQDCPNFSIYSSETMDVARHTEQELSQQIGPLEPPPLPPEMPDIPDDEDIIVGDVQMCDLSDIPEPPTPYIEALQKERQTISKIPPKKISANDNRGKITFKINKLKLNNKFGNVYDEMDKDIEHSIEQEKAEEQKRIEEKEKEDRDVAEKVKEKKKRKRKGSDSTNDSRDSEQDVERKTENIESESDDVETKTDDSDLEFDSQVPTQKLDILELPTESLEDLERQTQMVNVSQSVDLSELPTQKLDDVRSLSPDISELETQKLDVSEVETQKLDISEMETQKLDLSELETQKLDESEFPTEKLNDSELPTQKLDDSELPTQKLDDLELPTQKLDQVDTQSTDISELETQKFEEEELKNLDISELETQKLDVSEIGSQNLPIEKLGSEDSQGALESEMEVDSQLPTQLLSERVDSRVGDSTEESTKFNETEKVKSDLETQNTEVEKNESEVQAEERFTGGMVTLYSPDVPIPTLYSPEPAKDAEDDDDDDEGDVDDGDVDDDGGRTPEKSKKPDGSDSEDGRTPEREDVSLTPRIDKDTEDGETLGKEGPEDKMDIARSPDTVISIADTTQSSQNDDCEIVETAFEQDHVQGLTKSKKSDTEHFPLEKEGFSQKDVATQEMWDSDGGYTPCKDELPLKERRKSASPFDESGLEPITPTRDRNDDLGRCRTPPAYAGLGTEAISETDEAMNFEDELTLLSLRKEKEMEEGEILEDGRLIRKDKPKEKDEDGRKKKKKDKREKNKETEKNKENISSENFVPWKKMARATKDRNYREKERRSRSREKDKDKKKKKEAIKKKEKRKELPRYDVRKIVSEKPRSRKDEYGRDIRDLSHSLTRSRSRSRSVSRTRRSLSKGRRSRSYSRFRSKSRSRSKRRSWSREFQRVSRGRSYSRGRSFSPRRRKSPRRNSVSRKRKSRSLSRRRRSLTPRGRDRRKRSHSRKRRSRSRSKSRDRRKEKKKHKSRSRSRLRKRSRSKSPKRSSKSRDKKHSKRKQISRSRSRSLARSLSQQRDRNRNWELAEKILSREQHFRQREDRESWSAQWTPSLSPSRSKTPERGNEIRGWTPPHGLENVTVPPKNLTVILTNKEAMKKKKKEKKKERRKSDKDDKRKKGKRTRTPPPSKEVFASGDNILVSVCFNKDNESNQIQAEELPETIPLMPPTKRRRREPLQIEPPKKTKKDKAKDKRAKSPKAKKDKKKKSKATEIAATKKPVAVIDLDQSPFREQTPSPRDVIVLSDDDEKQAQALIAMEPHQSSQSTPPRDQFVSQGPKTPPEPQVKFSINKQANSLRPSMMNPLMEEEEEEEIDERVEEELEMRAQEELELRLKIGPNTPPEPPSSPPTSPDAYDPFDPTKSRSPTPVQSQEATPLNDERNQRASPRKHDDDDTPLTSNETQEQEKQNSDKQAEKPKIISMVTIKRASPKRDISPADDSQTDVAIVSESPSKNQQSQQNAQSTAAPFPTINPVLATVAAAVQRSNLFNTNAAATTQRSLAQTNRISPSSQIKQRPLERPQLPNLFTNSLKTLPLRTTKPAIKTSTLGQNGNDTEMANDYIDMSSPYSPGSSLSDGMFDPPSPYNTPPPDKSKSKSKDSKKDAFDVLFGASPANARNTTKVKIKKDKRKKSVYPSTLGTNPKVGVRMDENQLQILDDLPSSAVEMQVKDKFLKKLNRQERVVEEVKLVLKPHYTKKHVTKEEYKDIMRKAVPKICHNRSGEINPKKIAALIEAYVKKCRGNKKRSTFTTTTTTNKMAKTIKNLWS